MPDDILVPAEWYKRGSHDIITARIALEASAPTDTVAILLQQAFEKYIKGYLLSKGWRLKKTHDLRELIDRAADHDPVFAEFRDLARLLTALYIEDRYPTSPSAGYSSDEMSSLMHQTERLIVLITEKSG